MAEEARDTDGKVHPNADQVYTAPSQRNEQSGHSQPSYAPASTAVQPETQKYGTQQQQHWERGYMQSPKREAGDH